MTAKKTAKGSKPGKAASRKASSAEAPPELPPQPDRGSLFERASTAFGFDRLSPPPPPIVGTDTATKFAPRRVDPLEATGLMMPKGAKNTPPLRSASPAAHAPRPASPLADDGPKVEFNGPQREIVRSLLREQGMIDPDGGASALLEEFRIVKRQVLAAAKAKGTPQSRRILVSSPHPDEGKTFCALNLALALAGERDTEVVLVDADIAKPSILPRLGLETGKGLMDVLADGDSHIEDHVVPTDIPGLYVLGAGGRTGRDAEYLASERTSEVLARLTQGAPGRFVIFDSPPALAASPAAELAKHAGQVLLVARADCTSRVALEDAVDLLSACADIKLVLNDSTFSPSGRRFGSYYGYGE